jgi:hypothetical protein
MRRAESLTDAIECGMMCAIVWLALHMSLQMSQYPLLFSRILRDSRRLFMLNCRRLKPPEPGDAPLLRFLLGIASAVWMNA